jgi:multidrug resistance efflux pump
LKQKLKANLEIENVGWIKQEEFQAAIKKLEEKYIKQIRSLEQELKKGLQESKFQHSIYTKKCDDLELQLLNAKTEINRYKLAVPGNVLTAELIFHLREACSIGSASSSAATSAAST